MSDVVLVALITGGSTLAGVVFTLLFESWRDREAREESHRQARLERVKGAYRLALEGAQAIRVVVTAVGYPPGPGETLIDKERRIDHDLREGWEMLNRAWIELTLENVSSHALGLDPQILSAYNEFRATLFQTHPDSGFVPFETMRDASKPLFDVMEQQREAIQAHLAELAQPPKRTFAGILRLW